MKRVVLFLLLSLCFALAASSQITNPVIRGNFGVDADLRANYFNGFAQAGNDDWFTQPAAGAGQFIIDTSGAAAMVARYAIDLPYRRTTWARTMRYPAFSIVNNRLLLDAIFVRDFHGDDSTVFSSGGNKNGDDPSSWQCPVSQGIPDKNDILDMMVHVRRAGPNITDSLWMFGGMSLDNTTGNRYFDFEMYQTDLVYNRSTLSFSGQGPDAGHTSWKFDAAGNIIQPGDIIFSAEYQSSSLTNIEARIWVDSASLKINPVAFTWGGLFDGASAGARFGYASIQPKASGAYYTGLQCGNGTWGGPFAIILQSDAMATDYTAKQYVEFSVNLTKLGLDPVASFGGEACAMPFRRILVKTRASASFTAELKDFVAPFAFFAPPKVDLQTASASMCNQGSIAEIHVSNPLSTSTYQWTTTDGNIISSPTGSSVFVDTPGTYVVTQYLFTGCSAYATDTVTIVPSKGCIILPASVTGFRGVLSSGKSDLAWTILNNQLVDFIDLERSTDGENYVTIARIPRNQSQNGTVAYAYSDEWEGIGSNRFFYRLKLLNTDNSAKYSTTIMLTTGFSSSGSISVFPNPARDIVQLQLSSEAAQKIRIEFMDPSGKLIAASTRTVQKGQNVISLPELERQPRGVYLVVVRMAASVFSEKILLVH
jgi:hypothetical protein